MRIFLEIFLTVVGIALLADFCRFFLTKSDDSKILEVLKSPFFKLVHAGGVGGMILWIVQILAGLTILEFGIKIILGIL